MSTLTALLMNSYNFPLPIKIIGAFLGGVIPVLIWLWFWEHEDKYPEPKKLVIAAFIGGMIAVAVALVLEQIVAEHVSDFSIQIFWWAAIEELVKLAAAYIMVLSRAENHEPIDSMMYMITTALGFSAIENSLFLFFGPIMSNNTLDTISTLNMRFIGATLLHTITSGVIGFALALTFYRSKRAKIVYVTIGVITAIILHAAFNLSIIIFDGSAPILPFYAVWIAIVAILLAFEKVKSLRKSS